MRGHLGSGADHRSRVAFPSFTSTGCSTNVPGRLLVHVVADVSGRCWTRSPPRATFSSWTPRHTGEHRHIALERRLEERELAPVAPRLGLVRLGMGLGTVERGIEVGAAREHDSVEQPERLLDAVLARRDEAPGARPRARPRPHKSSGISAAGSRQAPHLASWAYVVIPITGLMHASLLHDPQCAVRALERRAVPRLAADPEHAHLLAVPLEQGSALARAPASGTATRAPVERPPRTIPIHVDPRVLGLEERVHVLSASDCGSPGSPPVRRARARSGTCPVIASTIVGSSSSHECSSPKGDPGP